MLAYLDKDYAGNPRLSGMGMDIGCGEFQVNEFDFASFLHPAKQLSLVGVSCVGVTPATNGTVVISGGTEISWRWTVPSSTTVPVGYSFTVSVDGDATLSAYVGGATDAAVTVTAADGEMPFGYFYTGTHTVRLVVTGSGKVTLSTLKCSDFGANNWYVNPEGNDLADGKSPETARKTLVEAMKLASSGDVVHAARGAYAEGLSPTILSNDHTTNRVIIASGVGLVADEGPSVTIIEGSKPASGEITSDDAVRCVALSLHSWLKGFTLRNGATAASGGYQDCGGGSYYSNASECSAGVYGCVYDNCSARRGGGGFGGLIAGCRFNANCDASNEAKSIYDCKLAVNCVFKSSSYGKYTLVNCSSIGCTLNGNGVQMAYNTYFGSARNSNITNCCGKMVGVELAAAETLDDADAPKFGSALIDAGDYNNYRTNFPSAWAMFSGMAVNGVRRVRGAAIDVGAGEFSFVPSQLPATSGVTVVADGNALTVTRNHQSERLVTGFTLNGTEHSFPAPGEGDVVAATFSGSVEDIVLAVTCVTTNDYYVNQASGDDGNVGYAPNVAFKTLAKALTTVTSGSTVYVAPGVYRESDMLLEGTYAFAAVVPANVRLVATGDKSGCVIEGSPDPDVALNATPYGCGPKAVRCVYLKDGAELHGFTVRNGHGRDWTTTGTVSGAGVFGTEIDRAIIYDCIITNNYGGTGAGVCKATAIRCEIAWNYAGARNANLTGDAYSCYLHDDYTPDGGYVYGYGGKLFGCTVLPTSCPVGAGAQQCNIHETYVQNERNHSVLTNSYYVTCGGNTTIGPGCRKVTVAEMQFDSRMIPVYGSNVGIDQGDWDDFTNDAPANVLKYLDKDFNGNPRVSNGAMDIGCCEFDYCPFYSQKLKKGPRVYTVTSASPAVTLADDGVTLPGGASLAGTFVTDRTGASTAYATVTGEGSLTVTVDGAPVSGTDGCFSFTCTPNEEHVLAFAFSGTGSATVNTVHAPIGGMLMIVR